MKRASIALLTILLAACSSTPKKEISQTPGSSDTTKAPSVAAQTGPSGNNTTPASTLVEKAVISAPPAISEADKLAAEIQKLQGQGIYFDFDKSAIRPEYRKIVEQQAVFLKANKNGTVTLEGNADERGSNEYNLALGNRRADATRKNLEILGIPSSQIKVISYGEEKPRLTCHEEKCWQENRRCDFVHKLN